jgi:hypothetical protein
LNTISKKKPLLKSRAEQIAELLDCTEGIDGLAFWSFRYFTGRMTIAACCFAEGLGQAWPLLGERTRKLIRKELEELFVRDDEARAAGEEYRPLGMDCDREAWECVRRAWQAEEERTEEKKRRFNESMEQAIKSC